MLLSNHEQKQLMQLKNLTSFKVYMYLRQREEKVISKAKQIEDLSLATYKEIREQTGISQTQLNKVVKELVELELIVKETKPTGYHTVEFIDRFKWDFEWEEQFAKEHSKIAKILELPDDTILRVVD